MITGRRYQNIVSLTYEGVTYRWGSDDIYYNGHWYDSRLLDFPTPSQAFRDDYGITKTDSVSITVADDPSNADVTLLTESLEEILTESGDPIVIFENDETSLLPLTTNESVGVTADLTVLVETDHDDGTTTTTTWSRRMNVRGWTREVGQVSFKLEDLDYDRLETQVPADTYTTDDWPNLYEDDVGRPVPYPVGTILKLTAAFLDDGGGSGPWKYGVCQDPDDTVSVLTVYREGRIVDSSEYSVVRDTSPSGYDLTTLEFSKEQVDFDNNRYTIEVDVERPDGSNVVDEIQRLLELAGFSTDSTSFSNASSYYGSNVETQSDVPLVEQRSVREIVTNLLLPARAHLYRLSYGSIAIEQDKAKSSSLTLDEDAGDPVEVTSLSRARLPATVELDYRPAIRDPRNDLQHTRTRETTGADGVKRYKSAYLRTHSAADRTVDFLAKRMTNGQQAKATIYDDLVSLGDRITISSSNIWGGFRDWIVQSVTYITQGQELDLLEYEPDVYIYGASPLPTDAVVGYKPDYSETPPSAPSNLSKDAEGTQVNDDGLLRAWIEVSADLPSVNASFIEFLITNDDTNEQFIQKGRPGTDPTWYVRFKGLEPNSPHTVTAWAVNNFGVEGTAA